ncbi:MAG: family 10 glycosylhydrolase [Gemmatimonadaceae bacterium]|nr:family 10 glycosylhydrolase [Gemmatimonadaceae bacterium]
MVISTRRSLALFVLCGVAACSDATAPPAPVTPTPSDTATPAILREMRGVWIATVANIDWPSRNTLTADQQRAELDDLLDRAALAGLNAVFFHARPASDAVYQSALEPWGAMLTGTQGRDPGYDPLAYAVNAAHARGLELHAWINPFRAGNTRDSLALAPSHLFRTRRNLLRVYGSQLWLEPGDAEVHDHVMRVVLDIVRRYDIDGIHADDYFYPYQERDAANRLIDFPDSATWAQSGTTLARDDWRRANVDRFVERLQREVHAIRPTLKVGISPFGIWRPGNPPGVNGLDAWASIFADSRKWLQQGWVDYLAPQLYWSIAAPQQSFPALLDWWMAQNSRGRHVWPGLAVYRVLDGTTSAFPVSEITDQVRLTRSRSGAPGHLLYNATSTLRRSGGLVASSLAPLYGTRALVPAFPWLDSDAPLAPALAVAGTTLTFTPAIGEAPRWWFVRARASTGWTTRVLFGDARTSTLTAAPDRVLLSAVDQAGNVSPPAEWRAR